MRNTNKKIILILLIFCLILSIFPNLTSPLYAADMSDGLQITDFTLTNTSTGSVKSETESTARNEYLQLKISFDYNGKPLIKGDKLYFKLTQPNPEDIGIIYFMGKLGNPSPIYNSDGIKIAEYTFKNNNNVTPLTSGVFEITMLKDATKLENLSIITGNKWIRRETSKTAIMPNLKARIKIGNLEKSFLLQEEIIKTGQGHEIGTYVYEITDSNVRWGFGIHGYQQCYNAKPENTEKKTFENALAETRLDGLKKPIDPKSVNIRLMTGLPSCDATGISSLLFSSKSLMPFFKEIEQLPNEDYEHFKSRVKDSGEWSWGIFNHSNASSSIVVYQGTLSKAPCTYEDLIINKNTPTFVDFLKQSKRIIGPISPEQENLYNHIHSNNNGTDGKIISILISFKAEYEQVKAPKKVKATSVLTQKTGTFTSENTATMTPNYGEGSSSTFATVSKVWKDSNNIQKLRPSSCTLKLFQNENLYKTLTLTPSNAIANNPNTWELTINNLPEYDNLGNKYFYSVKEDPVELSNGDKYIPSISKNIVTNTLSGKTSITITKVWRDWDNKYNTRPESLIINIFNNKDEKVEQVTLTSQNASTESLNVWELTVNNLEKYDENGVPYTYHIKEEFTPELELNYDKPTYDESGLIVTNKAFFVPYNHKDEHPDYTITVHKNIVNNSGKPATAVDFEKINLNANETYQFPIVLRPHEILHPKDANGRVYESYGKLLDETFKGVVTNKGDLVFNNISAGKYLIEEIDTQYFDFVNFEKALASTNAKLEKEGNNYYIILPGLTGANEEITVNVNNKIDAERPFNEEKIKNNFFKQQHKSY